MPILRGEIEKFPDNVAFIETDTYEIGIRTPAHMYGMKIDQDKRDIVDEEFCFFDLINDSYEEYNLAKTDQQRDIAKDLRARLKAWHENTPWLKI